VQPSLLGHRGVAQVAEPPFATGTHIVGGNAAAPGALPAAGAPHLSRYRRVAKPWTEEPDAGNLHVGSAGASGEQSPEGDPTDSHSLEKIFVPPPAAILAANRPKSSTTSPIIGAIAPDHAR
jgi:hypothetical protein